MAAKGMSQASEDTRDSAGHELEITRIFDAPRDLVWQAWTDPDRMVHWLGPRGYGGSVERLDRQVGGNYRFRLRSPEGTDLWMQGVHREVRAPELLSYTFAWADAQGNPTSPETLVTVAFAEHDGKTRLTLHQTMFESVAARDGHRVGWESSFDCLADYLRAA